MHLFRRPALSAAGRSVCRRAACLCLLASASAAAQGVLHGALHGTAAEPDGTALYPATLVLENLETGERTTGDTLRDGSFTVTALAAGEYRLSLGGLAMGSSQGDRLAITPGETLEVQAEVGRTHVVTPFAGDPGGPQAEPDEDGDGLLSVRGLGSSTVGSTLDGASTQQAFGAVPLGRGSDRAGDPDDDADSAETTTGPGHGLARGRRAGIGYSYAQGSVREFRLGSDINQAQVGHAGGVLAAVSRAGGERLHGSAFFRLRSSALDAANPLAIATQYHDGLITSHTVKPHDLREAFGLTLGGPVPGLAGNSLRYFGAIDRQRRGFPAISSPADPDFYRLTPIQHALLTTRGLSDQAIDAQLNLLSSLTGETPRRAPISRSPSAGSTGASATRSPSHSPSTAPATARPPACWTHQSSPADAPASATPAAASTSRCSG